MYKYKYIYIYVFVTLKFFVFIHVLVSCLFYGASFCFVETILALRLTFAFFAGAFI